MIARAGTEKLPALWRAMVALAIIAAIPRFYWMLTGSYNAVIFIFIAFALLPFVVMNKPARRQTGFVRISLARATAAFVIGVAMALVVYLVGYWLFGNSDLNWFVVVMRTFDKDGIIDAVRPNVFLFLAIAMPVMTFSPLGEEFFFRGTLHESIAARFSPRAALAIDSAFFGITHLAHYGLYLDGGSLQLLPSAALWIVLMSLTAAGFYRVKQFSGSIWGAVLCHSGFNFSMMVIIFYVIR